MEEEWVEGEWTGLKRRTDKKAKNSCGKEEEVEREAETFCC